MPSGTENSSVDLGPLIEALGIKGVVVLAALAALLLLRSKGVRKAAYKLIRSGLRRMARWLHFAVWAWRYGLPVRTAGRLLDRKRWDAMVAARSLPGLVRRKVTRTPSGVAVNVTLTKSLTFSAVASRLDQLETGLGLRPGSARLLGTGRADKAVLELTVRDPLAGQLLWEAPAAVVRLADPVKLSVTPHGDAVTVSAKQRIGIFGTSGSGKSCVQRVIGAHVIAAVDADLAVIDLKQGLESQHFAGKARRITDVPAAAQFVDWLLDAEFPRRADRMKQLQTSSWKESAGDPALVVMVDEGNVLVRDFKDAQLKRFFTAVEQGRALGVYFTYVTQFPKATNLPTELRSQLNVRICLRLESSQESELVFKEEAGQGWEPHKLRDHWLLVKSSKHRAPDESKAIWLDEKRFRTIAPGRQVADVPVPAQTPAAAAGAAAVLVKPPVARTEPTVADLAWSVLAMSDKPMGVRELAREISRDPGATTRALKKLASAGQAVQGDDGKYRALLSEDAS